MHFNPGILEWGGGSIVNCLHFYVHVYVTPGEVSQ